ncbi:septal ring lytic transglycosylase RlpA family protein [Novosphingobium colocasiae]|uniref:septal ring lytic transglycosylase RlpA family protein n=1 Tax=Novosphingobium colocasiae TaxID=1256513 RepID=UPI0016799B0E|nr:SPOR domain-containing protein [Novosphingobium colocasiae]
MKLPNNVRLPVAALICLAAGTAIARDRIEPAPLQPTGPAADYPVVVGEPYTIGSVTWTPVDQLNYDAVGNASVGAADGAGITAAHKTLPLPCYVEVTALDTGRTILVRIERRGPMVNDTLIDLSPAAAAQLGVTPGSHPAVRVRRVNPPEPERAALRQGGTAPLRMDTPEPLLKVLRRKLASQSPLQPPPSTPPSMPKLPTDAPAVPAAPVAKAPKPAPKPVAPPSPVAAKPAAAPVAAAAPAAPAAATAPKAAKGTLVVQIGAFASEANARALAGKLNANVSRSGKLWRVYAGPFASRGQASAALEKVKSAGYSGLIQSAD